MNADPYFNRPEVSNSELTAVKMYYANDQWQNDASEALRFGTLVDAIITEPDKADHYRQRAHGIQYTQAEWEQAQQMRKAFMADSEAAALLKASKLQHVSTDAAQLQWSGLEFEIKRRCKWDGLVYSPRDPWGWDLKSTFATSQKQFEEAARYFDYPRSRAWYMDIVGARRDLIIGVSKINFKVFKIRTTRGDDFYTEGREQYHDLAYRWWVLFGGLAL